MSVEFFNVNPPVDMVMPDAQIGLCIAWGVCALGSALFCINHSLRNKSWLAVNILIGSGFAMFAESLIIQDMHCWYPAINQISVYTSFGHPVPLFACFAYLFYFAPGILVMMKKYEQGITQRQFWTFWLGCVVFTVFYEIAVLSFDLCYYYGYQPLRMWKLPLTWPIINTMTFIPFSVVMYYARPHLRGPWMLLVIPAMATAVPTFETMAAYPLYVAINNSATPIWLANIAALLSIGMTLAAVAVCARLVCVPASSKIAGRMQTA